MIAAPSPAHSPPRWAANSPFGEVPAVPPPRDIDRFHYQHPRQRQPLRPPLQKRPAKDKPKPDDEHKVDDYA